MSSASACLDQAGFGYPGSVELVVGVLLGDRMDDRVPEGLVGSAGAERRPYPGRLFCPPPTIASSLLEK
jgi:hypothetical protein